MKRTRFTDLPKLDDPRLTHVLVRSQSPGGYWGRGTDVATAIANGKWFGSQSKVYVCQCDAKAYCDDTAGDLHTVARGPIYAGKVMASRKDVMVGDVFRDAKLT